MNKKTLLIIVLIVFISLLTTTYIYYQNKQKEFRGTINETKEQLSSTQQIEEGLEVIAQNLNIPWEVAFLPYGEILVTERPGTLLLIKSGQKIPIEGVAHVGEGGLLGVAIHPDFANNHLIYLY